MSKGSCFVTGPALVCWSLWNSATPAKSATLSDPCGATAPPCNDTLPSLSLFKIQKADGAFALETEAKEDSWANGE
jgi:hypothetical protein